MTDIATSAANFKQELTERRNVAHLRVGGYVPSHHPLTVDDGIYLCGLIERLAAE